MPDKPKTSCSESQKSHLITTNLKSNDYAQCNSDLEPESSAKKGERAKPACAITRKGRRKQPPQPSEVIQHLELEETLECNAAKHGYYFSLSDPYNIQKMVEKKSFSSLQNFKLHLQALKIKQTVKIDRLISVDAIRTKLVPYNFQLQLALRVINEMNGNAILADEVGLGKTIEAGLIMKEMLLREEIKSILIVCPKSLLTQWRSEMAEKFGEAFSIANNHNRSVNLKTADRIICSHNLLARKLDEIASRTWDLIVVDEAHAFRNTHNKGRAALANLRKNHFLLLTATPLCNRLTDLYSIVDLIQPGLLDSERSFISRFADDSRSRVVKPEAADQIRCVLQEVMCRTLREQTGIPFTKRFVDSRSLEADPTEREFIDQATKYLRDISQNHFKTIEALIAENPTRRISTSQSQAILVFQAIALQQSFSSSPEASIESLRNRQRRFPSETLVTNQLIELAKHVRNSKIELLKQVLHEIPNEQALIFCLRKTTARRLKEVLDPEFGKAAVYLGDMSQTERDNIIDSFRDGEVRYLIATDTAAEGLNLQNCCVLFNYDLHWNPMKIEQRIGRIHRYKQERDVTVFNLTIKDTIDDYVLHILYQKIDLFTMTVGKMETVLAELKEGSQDIQKTIMEILLRSCNHIDIQREIEKITNDLTASMRNQELAEKFTQGVLS